MRAHPTADRFLTGFREAGRGRSLDAIDRLDCDLRFAIEMDGPDLLTADDAVLLHAARQLEPVGPVGRVLGLPDLVRLLTRFIVDPAYRSAEPTEARDRLEACETLLRALANEPALDGPGGLVQRAGEAIRLERARLGRRPAQR